VDRDLECADATARAAARVVDHVLQAVVVLLHERRAEEDRPAVVEDEHLGVDRRGLRRGKAAQVDRVGRVCRVTEELLDRVHRVGRQALRQEVVEQQSHHDAAVLVGGQQRLLEAGAGRRRVAPVGARVRRREDRAHVRGAEVEEHDVHHVRRGLDGVGDALPGLLVVDEELDRVALEDLLVRALRDEPALGLSARDGDRRGQVERGSGDARVGPGLGERPLDAVEHPQQEPRQHIAVGDLEAAVGAGAPELAEDRIGGRRRVAQGRVREHPVEVERADDEPRERLPVLVDDLAADALVGHRASPRRRSGTPRRGRRGPALRAPAAHPDGRGRCGARRRRRPGRRGPAGRR
jgi:hypothetical protein